MSDMHACRGSLSQKKQKINPLADEQVATARSFADQKHTHTHTHMSHVFTCNSLPSTLVAIILTTGEGRTVSTSAQHVCRSDATSAEASRPAFEVTSVVPARSFLPRFWTDDDRKRQSRAAAIASPIKNTHAHTPAAFQFCQTVICHHLPEVQRPRQPRTSRAARAARHQHPIV